MHDVMSARPGQWSWVESRMRNFRSHCAPITTRRSTTDLPGRAVGSYTTLDRWQGRDIWVKQSNKENINKDQNSVAAE